MKKIIYFMLLSCGLLLNFHAYGGAQRKIEKQSCVTSRVLWGAKISPYVRKVVITLEEKKVPYTIHEILPSMLLRATDQPIPNKFERISPFGKIPAYEEIEGENLFSISESSVIMEYIEQTVANNPLRPICSKMNARVSWWLKYADDTLAPITHRILFEKIVKPSVLKQESDVAIVKQLLHVELVRAMDYLEETLSSNQRSWIADTTDFSLADIAVVSHLVTLNTADENLHLLIGESRPQLQAYVEKVFARDSFQKAMP